MSIRRFVTSQRLSQLLLLVLLLVSFFLRAGKGIEATFAMALIAGAVTLLCFRTRVDAEEVSPWIFWSGILFLFWTVVSFLLSSTKNYGIDEVLRDSAGFLLFLYASRRRNEERFMDQLLLILSSLALLASAVGIAVYIFQPVTRFVGVFFHVFDQRDYWPNAWAEFVLLTWPLVWVGLKKHSKAFRIVALGLLLGCLALSFSRGAGMVFFVQVICLGVWALWMRKGLRLQTHFAVVASTAAIAIGIFVCINALRANVFPMESLIAKATLTASEGTQTVDERKQFWKQALELTMQKPLTGWGPYSFRFVQPRLQNSVLATSDHPHNLFLKLAMERGIPAAVLLAVFVLWIVLSSRCFCLRDFKKFCIALAVFGVIAHNLIDYNLQFTLIAVPFWLLLGVLPGEALHRHHLWTRFKQLLPLWREQQPVFIVRRCIEVTVACSLLLFVVLEGRLMFFEKQARSALQFGYPAESLEYFEKARHMLYPRDVHLDYAQVLLEQHQINRATDVLQESRKLNAEDHRLWILLGDISFMADRFDDARTAYTQAMTLGGWNDLRPLHGVLEVLGRKASQTEKDRFFSLADSVLDEYANAIEHNMHFIALSWLSDEFQAVSRVMANIYPEHAVHTRQREGAAARAMRHYRDERLQSAQGFLW